MISKQLGCALLLAAAGLAAAAERVNLFNVTAGAVVLARSEFNDGSWSAFNLFDSNPTTGWCSPEGKPRGNEIVIELAQRHRLDAIVLGNTQVQEGKYPGISARSVEVWASTTAPDAGMNKVAAFEAPRGGRREFALPSGTQAEWVKLIVVDNWGEKTYTELMDVEAYGAPVGEPPKRSPITGIYQTNYGPLQLAQNGGLVTGCYYGGDGTVSGATDGRVLNLEWRQNKGARSGALLMVLTTRGDVMNGVWYRNGALQGSWSGRRDPKLPDECRQPKAATIGDDLKQSGRAIAYGIHFRSDSDVLSADSEPMLKQIAALLRETPTMHLRVEGHTDATNTDAYNLELSRRRAQAVVKWLVDHGIAGDRVPAEGYGKGRPVADNATPQGRALNRRVELVTVK